VHEISIAKKAHYLSERERRRVICSGDVGDFS
jgi:hypothetical protein